MSDEQNSILTDDEVMEAIAEAMIGIFDVALRVGASIAASRTMTERGQALAAADRADEERESRRRVARDLAASGDYTRLDETVLEPTPEWLAQVGQTVPYTPKGEDNTVRSVRTVRRYQSNQLTNLHGRGLLTDETLLACKWYRDRYEAAQMEPHYGVANYGESVRGDPLYGHLPSTQWAAEARADFRWASAAIPAAIKPMFDCVVLADMPIDKAKSVVRMGFSNARAAFLLGADLLYERVQFRIVAQHRSVTR